MSFRRLLRETIGNGLKIKPVCKSEQWRIGATGKISTKQLWGPSAKRASSQFSVKLKPLKSELPIFSSCTSENCQKKRKNTEFRENVCGHTVSYPFCLREILSKGIEYFILNSVIEKEGGVAQKT